MAAAQKLYPRATLKKIVKAHSKRNLSKNVDVLVGINNASPLHKATYADIASQIFLDYVLFLETYVSTYLRLLFKSFHPRFWAAANAL
jgi:hypothetical protein